jgi:hypothetical protein
LPCPAGDSSDKEGPDQFQTYRGSLNYGYKDAKGRIQIPAMFYGTNPAPFRVGLALVELGRDRFAYIDNSGAIVYGPF